MGSTGYVGLDHDQCPDLECYNQLGRKTSCFQEIHTGEFRGHEGSHLQLDLKRFRKILTSPVKSITLSVRICLEEGMRESINVVKCYQLGRLGEEESCLNYSAHFSVQLELFQNKLFKRV